MRGVRGVRERSERSESERSERSESERSERSERVRGVRVSERVRVRGVTRSYKEKANSNRPIGPYKAVRYLT